MHEPPHNIQSMNPVTTWTINIQENQTLLKIVSPPLLFESVSRILTEQTQLGRYNSRLHQLWCTEGFLQEIHFNNFLNSQPLDNNIHCYQFLLQ